MNIILTGFMASGKSSVGRKLERFLERWKFIDMDSLIVEKEKCSINEIFEKKGEKYFRDIESEIVRKVSDMDNVIVSTGGGVVLSSDNMDAFEKNGIIIYLHVNAETVLERIKDDKSRPLLKVEDPLLKINELLEKREPFYKRNNYMVHTSLENTDKIAGKIIDLLPKVVDVNLGENSCKIFVGKDFTESIKWIKKEKHKKALIITDEKVHSLYYSRLEKELDNKGFNKAVKILPRGEQEKNLDTVKDIYNFCIDQNMDRSCLIIALGGGVIGDISGFVAATFLRGIKFIQIPTTVVAQVDASIGGKTGVDMPQGKNLVGSFYQPQFVWIDPSVLQTLDEAEYRNGLSEVVKSGIIRDKNLFDFLDNNINKVLSKDKDALLYIVHSCAQIKADVVSMDEKEGNLRRILNFGHTLGHAIETYEEYKGLKHGEAVAVGMDFAAYLSYKLGHCNEDIRQRINNLFIQLGFDINSSRKKFAEDNNYCEKIIEIMKRDKKAYIEKVNFVLPVSIGEVKIVPVELNEKFKDILIGWGCL